MAAELSCSVILGSAFAAAPEELGLERREIETRWGRQPVYEATGLSRRAYVIFRHGLPRRLLPNQIAWRTQAAALAELDCGALLVTSSVGVLKRSIPLYRPLLVTDIVMPDNRLPDGSACTMFVEQGTEQGHLVIDEGLCSPALSRQVADIAQRLGTPVAAEVVFAYFCGPRIKTRAENRHWESFGADVDAMTLAPELVLANELGIPSAALAFGHKYSLPDAEQAFGDVEDSLRASQAAQERIVVEFLRSAEPVAFGNRLYRYTQGDDAQRG